MRVTDTVDGTQATATQPLVVTATARAARARCPASAARRRTCARRARPACSAAPATAARPPAAGDKVPHNGLARGDRDPLEGARQRRPQEGRRRRTTTSCSATTARTASSAARATTSCGATGTRRTTTRTRRTSSTAAPATTGSIPATARRSSRAAPARTTSGPTTAAAPSTAGPGKDTARVKLNGPWKVRNCERDPALLRLRLRRPRRLPEARREAQGRSASRRVGRGPRRALTYAREGGDQLAHDRLGARRPVDGQRQRVGVVAQLHAQERAAAALGRDEGRDALARPRRLGGSAGRRGPPAPRRRRGRAAMAVISRAARGHLGLGQRAGDRWLGWSWEYRAPSSRLEVKGRPEQWTKRRSPSARSPAVPG